MRPISIAPAACAHAPLATSLYRLRFMPPRRKDQPRGLLVMQFLDGQRKMRLYKITPLPTAQIYSDEVSPLYKFLTPDASTRARFLQASTSRFRGFDAAI